MSCKLKLIFLYQTVPLKNRLHIRKGAGCILRLVAPLILLFVLLVELPAFKLWQFVLQGERPPHKTAENIVECISVHIRMHDHLDSFAFHSSCHLRKNGSKLF